MLLNPRLDKKCLQEPRHAGQAVLTALPGGFYLATPNCYFVSLTPFPSHPAHPSATPFSNALSGGLGEFRIYN